jgi:hypothetical protein
VKRISRLLIFSLEDNVTYRIVSPEEKFYLTSRILIVRLEGRVTYRQLSLAGHACGYHQSFHYEL